MNSRLILIAVIALSTVNGLEIRTEEVELTTQTLTQTTDIETTTAEEKYTTERDLVRTFWDCDIYGIKDIRFSISYETDNEVTVSMNKQKALCIGSYGKCIDKLMLNDEGSYFGVYRNGKFEGCAGVL